MADLSGVWVKISISLILSCLLSVPVFAQEAGRIIGQIRVTKGDSPPHSILVELQLRGATINSAYADTQGRFGFYELESNLYHIIVNDDDYYPVDEQANVNLTESQFAMVQIQSGAYGLRTLSIGCCEVKRIATTLQENVSMRGRLEPAKELVAQTRLPGASRGRDDPRAASRAPLRRASGRSCRPRRTPRSPARSGRRRTRRTWPAPSRMWCCCRGRRPWRNGRRSGRGRGPA